MDPCHACDTVTITHTKTKEKKKLSHSGTDVIPCYNLPDLTYITIEMFVKQFFFIWTLNPKEKKKNRTL